MKNSKIQEIWPYSVCLLFSSFDTFAKFLVFVEPVTYIIGQLFGEGEAIRTTCFKSEVAQLKTWENMRWMVLSYKSTDSGIYKYYCGSQWLCLFLAKLLLIIRKWMLCCSSEVMHRQAISGLFTLCYFQDARKITLNLE